MHRGAPYGLLCLVPFFDVLSSFQFYVLGAIWNFYVSVLANYSLMFFFSKYYMRGGHW